MVGTDDLVEYIHLSDAVEEGGGDAKIVDPPTDIPLASSGAIRPPSVAVWCIGVEQAKAVNKSSLHNGVESGAFLIGEARVPAVALRVGQVDFLMSDIEIAAEDDRFALLQVGNVLEKGHIPLFGAVVEATGTFVFVVIL